MGDVLSDQYTVTKLAKFVGVTPRAVMKWASEGKLPTPILDRGDIKVWTAEQAREVLEWRKTLTAAARKERRRVFPKEEPKGRIT